MKIGDTVMYVDKGRYAKWFWGCLGTVINYTPAGRRSHASCRVRWMAPVEYYGNMATVSDFSADSFEVISEVDS